MPSNKNTSSNFPPPEQANKDGVLAMGGDLSTELLIDAYTHGIFPWYDPAGPILWHSPNPRMLLFPENLHVSKSMKKVLRAKEFQLSCDREFKQVMEICGAIPRSGQQGTWIDDKMIEAYTKLHQKGIAHSVEVWQENKLVGGLYGIALGKAFFGESMFSKVSNASKTALILLTQGLQKKGFLFIDCQVYTPHLESMGAELYPRRFFLEKLQEALKKPALPVEEWYSLFG